jgi:hypothetical protein
LGGSAKFFHTGWPRSEGEPKTFVELANKLQTQIRSNSEWTFNPILPGINEKSAKYIKDCGIDFIAWHDFFDIRDGMLFLTGQCACGNDWIHKFDDIKFKKLGLWFNPMTLIDPIKVLTIPFCSISEYILVSSHSDNFLLDRLRLTKLFYEQKINLGQQFTCELERLIQLVVNDYS